MPTRQAKSPKARTVEHTLDFSLRRKKLTLAGIVVLIAALLYPLSYKYFLSQEQDQWQGKMSLYRSTIVSTLDRFSYLPVVLSQDTLVTEALQSLDTDDVNAKLKLFAENAGLDAIFLMNTDGVTIAASNAGTQQSFVGQDYSFRPYFTLALSERQGRFYAIGSTTGIPGYFLASPVMSDQGDTIGVLAIKIDLRPLEETWQQSGERVLLSNSDGVVLLASDPAWRYRSLSALSADQWQRIQSTRQFPDQDLLPLDWSKGADGRVTLQGTQAIHLSEALLQHGWDLHYLAGDEPVTTRSWLATVIMLVAGFCLLALDQYRERQRIRVALRKSEVEEENLRRANTQLAAEIADRRKAEQQLERTQDELERASRLAALGELSASVTHEVGQPITAMRNHLMAAEFSGEVDQKYLSPLTSLVARMEGITKQLKFFGQPDKEVMRDADITTALREALALVQPNIDRAAVELKIALPDKPVLVQGNRLKLEQVMTNILRNAIDAMEGMPEATLEVSAGIAQDRAWFEIADTGHGLGSATLADLQEPFTTTRASGHGMGLGLAISAQILKEHNGQMSARDNTPAGTVFRVEIPALPEQSEDES